MTNDRVAAEEVSDTRRRADHHERRVLELTVPQRRVRHRLLGNPTPKSRGLVVRASRVLPGHTVYLPLNHLGVLGLADPAQTDEVLQVCPDISLVLNRIRPSAMLGISLLLGILIISGISRVGRTKHQLGVHVDSISTLPDLKGCWPANSTLIS